MRGRAGQSLASHVGVGLWKVLAEGPLYIRTWPAWVGTTVASHILAVLDGRGTTGSRKGWEVKVKMTRIDGEKKAGSEAYFRMGKPLFFGILFFPPNVACEDNSDTKRAPRPSYPMSCQETRQSTVLFQSYT